MSQSTGRNKRRRTWSKEDRAKNAFMVPIGKPKPATGKMRRAGVFATRRRT